MGSDIKHIVLVGNPNSGKSTLFNALTGLNQKTSNLPGTTIDVKVSHLTINQTQFKLTDLPGLYSLFPKSKDELISCRYLSENKIDLIVYVADVTNLGRQLMMFTQLSDLGLPIVLALTMNDIAMKRQIKVDVNQLSMQIGALVCLVNPRTNEGIEKLKSILVKENPVNNKVFYSESNHILSSIESINNYRHYLDKVIENVDLNHDFENKENIKQELEKRHEIVRKIETLTISKSSTWIKSITQKLDDIFIHPVYGFLSFFVILFLVFQIVFRLAEYPTEWIENAFIWLTNLVSNQIPEGVINNLVCQGILPGISGVLVFLPQIVLLFFLLTLLEDSGYMTRVSFITDRLMRKFGLNGKSIIPLIGGMACAIPAIMATRTIENRKERLITILVTPLMSCSARLPVFTVLAGLLVVDKNSFFDTRGLLILSLYILGFVMALIFGLLFKWILNVKEKSYFVLELPTYKTPTLKNVLVTLKLKVKDFVYNAGKVILIVSVILWFLANFAPGNQHELIDEKYKNYNGADKEQLIQGEKLESSYAGFIGKQIEPMIKPLGYDWKIGIALITSFAAREVFVGTMSTLYSIGDSEDEQKLTDTLKKQKNKDGSTMYSLPLIMSLLVFYAFAMQCISTLAITWRETKSIRWPIIQLLYMTGFAYIMSLITFQILN